MFFRNILLLFSLFYLTKLRSKCTPPDAQDLFIYPDKNLGARYYSNINLSDLTKIQPAKKAIIVIHGASLNANDYYCAMVEAAQIEGYNVYNNDIIIIAPNFLNSTMAKSNEYYFPHTWRDCGNSVNPSSNISLQISSCGVVDNILYYFKSNKNIFNQLINISIAGHSAGGQFVDRYALLSPIMNNSIQFNLQYIIANPSSFTWLDTQRWFDGGIYRNLTTSEILNAPEYNTWPYGWSNVSKYPEYLIDQNIELNVFMNRFINKNITYLQGTYDCCNSKINTTCDDHDMDTTPAADMQGIWRLQRGINFVRSLREIFGKPIHRLDMVPFVGHDDVGMFQSPNGRRAIF